MRAQLNWPPGPGVKILGITRKMKKTGLPPLLRSLSVSARIVECEVGTGTASKIAASRTCLFKGQAVKIKLALNRWQCRHRKCGRRTFTDRLPEIAAPYVRRTERMAEIVGLVGHRMGGRPGENLMHRLGMPVSDDTILRQLKRRIRRPYKETLFGL